MKVLQEGHRVWPKLYYLKVELPEALLMWEAKPSFLAKIAALPEVESFKLRAREDREWGGYYYSTTNSDEDLEKWISQASSLGAGDMDGNFVCEGESYRLAFDGSTALFIYGHEPVKGSFVDLIDKILCGL